MLKVDLLVENGFNRQSCVFFFSQKSFFLFECVLQLVDYEKHIHGCLSHNLPTSSLNFDITSGFKK